MSTHTSPAHPTEHAEPAEQFGVREYVHLAWQRIRGGETGILPVLGGFILVSIIFQILDQQYLTAGNLINLLVQSAVFMLLGMAEVLVLLLGEIDLSVGFVAGVSAVVLAWLAQPQVGWPWWATILAALVVTALIGLVQGSLVTRIGLPSSWSPSAVCCSGTGSCCSCSAMAAPSSSGTTCWCRSPRAR